MTEEQEEEKRNKFNKTLKHLNFVDVFFYYTFVKINTMKNYYYIIPNWQNEPLCIILVSNKDLKKAMK